MSSVPRSLGSHGLAGAGQPGERRSIGSIALSPALARSWAQAAGLLAVVLGLAVLAGWALSIERLVEPISQSASMKPNTALCLVALGGSLFLLKGRRGSGPERLVGAGLAVFAGTIALVTLGEYALGWNPGIDEALFEDTVTPAGASVEGRMSTSAAAALVLCALAVLAGERPSRRWRIVSESAALIALLVVMVGLLGYAYGAPALYGPTRGTQLALHTAVILFVLALALALSVRGGRVITLLTQEGAGGAAARRLLPVVLLLPPLLGIVRLGPEHAGLYGTELGLSLHVVVSMVILLALVAITARSLDRIERMRHAAAVRHRDLVESLPAIVYVAELGHRGRWHYVSPQIRGLLGFSAKEWESDPDLWAEYLHPEDQERVHAAERAALDSGQGLRIEYRMLSRDQRTLWFRDQSAPLARPDGERTAELRQGVMYDITEEKRQEEELRRSRGETMLKLALAAELRDDETGAHIQRVGRASESLAAALGLDDAFCERLRLAAPLHDVGKIGISDQILRKAGPLSDGERELMETHAEIGHRLLSSSQSEPLALAAEVALTHHERNDGRGYPRRIAGGSIPISGRIVAVADALDALTHARVYRPRAHTFVEVLAILESERGGQFDPAVLDALARCEAEIAGIMAG